MSCGPELCKRTAQHNGGIPASDLKTPLKVLNSQYFFPTETEKAVAGRQLGMWAVQNSVQQTVFAVGVDSSKTYLLTAATCRLCRPLGTLSLIHI